MEGETTREGAMKNHLSTKITAKQHAREFKKDFYADGDLLFFFAPAVSKHQTINISKHWLSILPWWNFKWKKKVVQQLQSPEDKLLSV